MSTECAASAPPVIAVNETKVPLHALDSGLGPCHSRRALRTCPACGLNGCPPLPVRTRPDVPAERREPADGLRVRAGHADAVTGGVRCAFSCSVHSKNAKLGSSGRSNSRSGEVLSRPSGNASYRCPSSTRWSELARESSAAVVARLLSVSTVDTACTIDLAVDLSRSSKLAPNRPTDFSAGQNAPTRDRSLRGPKSSVRHSKLTPIDIDRCVRLITDRLRVGRGRIPEQDRPNGLRSPLRQASDSRRVRRQISCA